MPKNKYLIFREKPYNMGKGVVIECVNHLNKQGINKRWDELEKIYPKEHYQSSLTTTAETLVEFKSEPVLP